MGLATAPKKEPLAQSFKAEDAEETTSLSSDKSDKSDASEKQLDT